MQSIISSFTLASVLASAVVRCAGIAVQEMAIQVQEIVASGNHISDGSKETVSKTFWA
jgi:hypothetical protein